MATQKHKDFCAISDNFAIWSRISPDCNKISSIGVNSYVALGHVPPPTDFQLFNFSDHFRAAQTLNIQLHVVTAYPVKSMQAFSFVTVYCMNFFNIFVCHP